MQHAYLMSRYALGTLIHCFHSPLTRTKRADTRSFSGCSDCGVTYTS